MYGRKEGSFEKISIYKSRIVNNEIRIFGRKIIISFNRREKENNFNFIERMYISSLIYIYDVVEPEREREKESVFDYCLPQRNPNTSYVSQRRFLFSGYGLVVLMQKLVLPV